MDEKELEKIATGYVQYLMVKRESHGITIDWKATYEQYEEYADYMVEQMNLAKPEDKQYYRDGLLLMDKIVKIMQAYEIRLNNEAEDE